MHFFKLPFILFRYFIRSPSDGAPALPENAGKSLLYALFPERNRCFPSEKSHSSSDFSYPASFFGVKIKKKER